MKKKYILLIIILLILAVMVGVFLLMNHNKQTVNVSSADNPITIPNQEEIIQQSYCNSLAERTKTFALSDNFVLDIRNLETIPNQHTLQGCVNKANNDYGNWITGGEIIATYEVSLSDGQFITQGVFSLDQDLINQYVMSGKSIPFEKNLRLNVDQLTTETGYITVSNYNTMGDPTKDEKIIYQITFEQ